ncbi:IS481 family transposase [Hymenobacter algoricola]|uniref:IS481 family transposase n=1 Tax=Hymenobacter algoricola TaxID=486267 RepID=UPI0031ECE8A2
MGQVLHGSARTTQAIRRSIQRSQESLQTLAKRHSIDPKTVAKWRKRTTTTDATMGPKPASTVLTAEEEAIAVTFRQHTLLPLDDCLYALQETIPHLSRSALHRCFQRHGVSRLPLSEDGQSAPKKKFKDYAIGYLHVDFAEVRTEQGRQYLFVAIDRTSKVAFAELQPRATRMLAADFLRRVLEKLPYKAHTVLTDNGVQFTLQPHQWFPGGHSFDRICRAFGVEHRLTKPAHPWTNGQVERFNRTIKEATVQRYHYESTAQLNEHLQAFLLAYNHAKRLKRLRGLTPHEFVCAQWQKNPTIFTQDPAQLTLGLYT